MVENTTRSELEQTDNQSFYIEDLGKKALEDRPKEVLRENRQTILKDYMPAHKEGVKFATGDVKTPEVSPYAIQGTIAPSTIVPPCPETVSKKPMSPNHEKLNPEKKMMCTDIETLEAKPDLQELVGEVKVDAQDVLPNGFSIEGGCLWYTKPGSTPPTSKIIGDELRVVGSISNKTGGGQARVIRFYEKGRKITKTVTMSIRTLYGDPKEALAGLADEGYVFTPGEKGLLTEYIIKPAPNKLFLTASRTGWLSDSTFALPHKIISADGQEEFFYTGDIRAEAFGEKGTLESWQELVATPAYDHPLLMFSIGCAFAAPLLSPLGIPGGGFHPYGLTETGKTTSLLVASSVTGVAKINGYMMLWRTTTNGLEATAEAYNDVLLPLDEMHQADPKTIQPMLYLLANGRGKQRANRQGGQKKSNTWNLLVLSSGEISAKEFCPNAPGGAMNRMIDIEVNQKIPPDFCKKIALAAEDNYGTAMPKFLEYVIRNKHEIRAGWQKFQTENSCRDNGVSCGASRGSARIFTRFDLVAYAGQVAFEAGVLPQNPSTVISKFIKDASAPYLTPDRDAEIVRIVQQYLLENSHKIHSTENQLKSPVCREVIGVAIDARSNRGNFGDCDDESIEGCCTIEFILLKGPLEDCLRLHSMSLSEALTALEAKGFLGKGEKGQGKQRRFTHPILAGQTRGYPILAGILNFK